MGKVPITTTTTTTAGGAGNTDSPNERLKRKKRRKDLEELRRNALAAKRNARSKVITQESQRSKSDFMKSLDEFAARRQDIENVVQSQNSLLNKPKLLKAKKLPHPYNAKGFFRAGIKGKRVSRTLSCEDEKLKDAVIHNDALQLMQSGGFCHNMQKQSQSKAQNNIDPQMKMELEKLFMSSSSGSDVDDPAPTATTDGKVQSSPVFGEIKGFKKKAHLLKVKSDENSEDISSQNRQSPVVQNITKEDRCKRQLFEEENKPVNNRNTEFLISAERDNVDAIRKSTPENVIFYKQYIPKKNLDKDTSKKQNNYKVNPSEPKLIQLYVETCQLIAEKNFKDIFWDSFKDPLDTAKVALKGIYANTFKDYVQRQKSYKVHQNDVESKSNISSNSETLLEPDSAIARTLKKNIGFQMKNMTDNICNDTNTDNLEKGYSVDTIEHNPMKRKFVSSSKSGRSDLEIPSSVRANVDPQTIKIDPKMDAIQPERQELIDRYLKDVNKNNTHTKKRTVFSDERSDLAEINCSNFQKEKLLISDISKRTYLLHKSTKHIPAILRKNRPTVNCIAEKEILFRVENYPGSNEVTAKISKQELNFDGNLKSERTPDCGNPIPNQLMEAPKCKYTYMNAKYNQPSRIQIQAVQEKRSHRNVVPERHLFASPNQLEQDFVLTQNFEPSPIRQEMNLSQKQYDFHRCHISQGSSEQLVNCMPRMASFGDIQERTDRLTLCSQESKDQMRSSQEERFNLHPNFYHQHESSNECMEHNNRPYVTYNKIPSQSIGNTYDHHNTINYMEKPSYISRSDFQSRQLQNCSSQRSEDVNYCLANDYQMCRKPHPHQLRQEPVMSCVPIQQQNVRQPIKFVAIEGNRLPQRRPVYSTSNGDSCSHPHKVSISNQQYAQAMKSYTMESSNQLYYPEPPVGFLHQEVSQLSPDFEYENIIKSHNAIISNMQAISGCSSQIPSSSRNYVNYVPSNMTNPSCIPQKNMPVHTSNNRQYIGHKIQIPILSPLYPQVGYKNSYYNENKGHRINDVYPQQKMNYNIHSKRP